MSLIAVPYCGLPVDPQAVLRHWNLDPMLLVCLTAVFCVYATKYASLAASSHVCFTQGWILGALALVSPLCVLSVSLFSARIGQHLILTTIAAPLLALGMPRIESWAARPLPAAIVFALTMWFWEAPGPYAATFVSSTVYWLMHISVIASAVWLWRSLISGGAAGAVTAAVGSMMQMGLLGALLTFAPRALYASHFITTAPYGLSPLQDQQLGGILMWVPGAVPFLAMTLVLVWRFLVPTVRQGY